jgi:purine-nucleoside/S-methyl-5'-thioadenosine phosphorylase / adenosine deaminase
VPVAGPTLTLPAPFEALGEHIAVDLPGARAVFTTRRGGVSTGPYESLNLGILTADERAHAVENQVRVAALAGAGRDDVARGRQVHGAAVERRTTPPDPGAELRPADGQATNLAGVPVQVLVADCLPVAIAGQGAVAMLHCGWRPLAAGIVAEGVRALRALGAEGPLHAAIGPGIGGCCYDVGDEVRAAFDHHGDGPRQGRTIDLKAIAAADLRAAGVERVHDVGLCTFCSDRSLFFSHRRDRGLTGRQAGIAWRA